MVVPEDFDYGITIVGGGPAGLAAAVGAGRMNRSVICFESGTPRTSHAPCYHNYLGFPDGISGEELLRRGRKQAERWGAVLEEAAVTAVEPLADGPPGYQVVTAGRVWRTCGVVFATGVEDRQPSCGSLYKETCEGVHYCVVCDGCETRGQLVAVIGSGSHAVQTIEALRDFTTELHLLLDGSESLDEGERQQIEAWGVAVHPAPLHEYRVGPEGISFGSDEDLPAFPHVFIAAGVDPRTEVAAALGCELDREGYIVTDGRQATSVPFVYAAGDCDGGHKQVTQAMAEGELAALELSRRLREAGFPATGLGTGRAARGAE